MEGDGRRIFKTMLINIENSQPSAPSSPPHDPLFASTRGEGESSVSALEIDTLRFSESDAVPIESEAKNLVRKIFQQHIGYDVMPERGELVVLDSQIPLSLAYEAFVYHDVIACPLWNSATSNNDGLVTLTDIIQALAVQFRNIQDHQNNNNNNNINNNPNNILQETIQQWRSYQIQQGYHDRSLISCYPDQSLYEICKTFQEHKVHKVALIDPNENTVLNILTHSDILHYLYQNFKDPQVFFNTTLQSLNIGTFDKLVTMKDDTPIGEVVKILAQNKLTGMPIISSTDGVIIDVYEGPDIVHSFGNWDEWVTSFNKPIRDAKTRYGVRTCHLYDTLNTIIQTFAESKVPRLICVDDHSRPLGVLSLTDLFSYFLNDKEVITSS